MTLISCSTRMGGLYYDEISGRVQVMTPRFSSIVIASCCIFQCGICVQCTCVCPPTQAARVTSRHGRPFPHSHQRFHETITEIAWSAFSTLPPEALRPSQKLHGRCDCWTPKESAQASALCLRESMMCGVCGMCGPPANSYAGARPAGRAPT